MNDDNDLVPIKMSELRRIMDESDKYKSHSILLNKVAWKISVALGDVPEGETEIYGDIEENVDRLIEKGKTK